ncbi:DUF58 domain-containing protein [Calycomorphotria hydatis]|uniref:Uncharacterized protein n=1 Tax=Calycomorphotria hydatis TaxID=2528027 RepID=A0A517TA15_9PLAN|nr:DUF58 domain-containing protein [Calycomorphotria hydatis]QDT65216.1 hypothetical protein V22_24630 [Calycomorphotria hydatis]
MSTKASSIATLDKTAAVFQHDFCPWANRWVYWLKNPVVVLTVATGTAAFVGMFVNPFLLLIAVVLASITVMGLVWPWLTMQGIECEVVFERKRIRQDKPVAAKLRISNRWPWPLWGLALKRGFEHDEFAPPAAALGKVSAWSKSEFDWEFTPKHRGVFPVDSPMIESAFPFGFWTARKPIECGQLIVWPTSFPLKHIPDAAAADFCDDSLSDHRAGDFGDLLGTRLFREGDSLRRVHWAQTARHGRLIFCERQAGAVASIRVIAQLTKAEFPDDEVGLETAIQVVASLCEFLPREHAQVECLLHGQLIQVNGQGSGFRQLMDALAAVPRDGFESPARQCRGTQTVEGMMTLIICGGHHQAEHLPRNSAAKIITVSGETADISADQRAWVQLTPDDLPRLADIWRRACHA